MSINRAFGWSLLYWNENNTRNILKEVKKTERFLNIAYDTINVSLLISSQYGSFVREIIHIYFKEEQTYEKENL